MVCQSGSEEMQVASAPCLHSQPHCYERKEFRPSAEDDGCKRAKMQNSSTGRQTQGNVYSPFPIKPTSGSRNGFSPQRVSSSSSSFTTPPQQQQQQHHHERRQQRPVSQPLTISLPLTDGDSDDARSQDSARLQNGGNCQPTHIDLCGLLSPPSSPNSISQRSHPPRHSSTSSVDSNDGSTLGVTRVPSPRGHGHVPPSPSSPSRSGQTETYLYLYRQLPKVSGDTDLDRLGRSMWALQEGGFYYPDLDSNGARALLEDAPEGTFLVRDSSDSKFLFALTVKTSRGATSVRIQYYRGHFQLDCEEDMKRKLPRFETMSELLDFHVAMCRERQGAQYRWLENSRRKDMVVRLVTPRRHSPPSLTHLARLAINQNLEDLHLPSRSTDLLPLPTSVKKLLRAYPHKV